MASDTTMPFHQFHLDDDRDWRSRWDAIDAFVREWLDSDFERLSHAERLAELEKSAGVSLPPSAREWCFFAFASEQLERVLSFRDCFVIERLEDHDAVALLIQGEADFYWAVEAQYLDQPDPPVTGYYLDHDDPKGRFAVQGPWAPTVSAFALDYLLSFMHSPGGGFSTNTSSAAFSREALVTDFGQPVTFGHLELFSTDGVLAFVATYPENWHHGVVTVFMQRQIPFDELPPSVRRLYPDAHIKHELHTWRFTNLCGICP